MEGRNDYPSEFKELALGGAQLLGRYLVLGGLAVNCYILLAPTDVQENETCERARANLSSESILNIMEAVLIKDLGLFTFYTAGAVRGIVIPSMHQAFNQVSQCLTNKPLFEKETLDKLKLLEESVTSSLAIAVTTYRLPIPDFLKYTFMLAAGAPLGRLGLGSIMSDYPAERSWPEIKTTMPSYQKAVGLIEGMLVAINCATASNLIGYYAVDNFYDAGHEQDFAYTNQLGLACLGVGAALGLASFFNESSYRMTTQASSALRNFYLIAMPLISTLLCFDLELENPETFYNKAVYAIVAISAFSLLVASLRERFIRSANSSERELNEGVAISIQEDLSDEKIVIEVDKDRHYGVGDHLFFSAESKQKVKSPSVSSTSSSKSEEHASSNTTDEENESKKGNTR